MTHTMRFCLLLSLLLGLRSLPPVCAASKAAAPPAPVAMTLAEAVLLAVRTNRSIKSAYLERVAQRFALTVAKDKFRPDVFIDTSVQYGAQGVPEIGQVATLEGAISPTLALKVPTGGTVSFVWDNSAQRITGQGLREKTLTTSLNLRVTQPLLKGAGIAQNTASIKVARFVEQANILTLKATIIDTVTAAIQAYYALIQAQQQLEISQQSRQRAQELLALNQALIRAGRLAKLEIVQAETEVASRTLEVTVARNTVDAARLNLIRILDIDRGTPVVAVEKIEVKPVSLEVEQLQSLALQHRPDYLQALLQVDIAGQDLLVARNNRLWTLSLTGEYTALGTSPHYDAALRDLGGERERAWNVGLLLSIPLGDLTLKQGVINAQVALGQGRLQAEEVRETIGTEVLDAVREVEVSLSQVTLARQVRELSARKLEIEREKLRLGLTTNFQLIAFQSDFTNAQSQELSAGIAYLNALAALDRVVSTTLATWHIAIEDGR